MSYSKVSGRYIYGNGDFYYFEGYIDQLFGGGNYSTGERVYWNSSDNDFFSLTKSYDITSQNYGYYILDDVINYTGSIYLGNHWREQGLKIISYYDYYNSRIFTPDLGSASYSTYGQHGYGLGIESGQIILTNSTNNFSTKKITRFL